MSGKKLESKIEQRLINSIELQVYTGLGRTKSREFADEIGATIHLDGRVLFDRIAIDKAIDEVRNKNNRNKWIPVSEKLPKEGEYVLCTVKELCDYPDSDEFEVPDTYICQGSYHYSQNELNGWYVNNHPDIAHGAEVIAWMPLPEPYQE